MSTSGNYRKTSHGAVPRKRLTNVSHTSKGNNGGFFIPGKSGGGVRKTSHGAMLKKDRATLQDLPARSTIQTVKSNSSYVSSYSNKRNTNISLVSSKKPIKRSTSNNGEPRKRSNISGNMAGSPSKVSGSSQVKKKALDTNFLLPSFQKKNSFNSHSGPRKENSSSSKRATNNSSIAGPSSNNARKKSALPTAALVSSTSFSGRSINKPTVITEGSKNGPIKTQVSVKALKKSISQSLGDGTEKKRKTNISIGSNFSGSRKTSLNKISRTFSGNKKKVSTIQSSIGKNNSFSRNNAGVRNHARKVQPKPPTSQPPISRSTSRPTPKPPASQPTPKPPASQPTPTPPASQPTPKPPASQPTPTPPASQPRAKPPPQQAPSVKKGKKSVHDGAPGKQEKKSFAGSLNALLAGGPKPRKQQQEQIAEVPLDKAPKLSLNLQAQIIGSGKGPKKASSSAKKPSPPKPKRVKKEVKKKPPPVAPRTQQIEARPPPPNLTKVPPLPSTQSTTPQNLTKFAPQKPISPPGLKAAPAKVKPAPPKRKPNSKRTTNVGQTPANQMRMSERQKKNLRASIKGLKNLANYWDEIGINNKKKQELNPFSASFTGKKEIAQTNVLNSKSEQRAKQAQEWTNKEIDRVVQVIKDFGSYDSAKKETKITFGELFLIYEKISDTLVFMLLKAKKRKRIFFDAGEMLLQGRDDHVEIIVKH